MIDQIFDRQYRAGRHLLNASLVSGFAQVFGAVRNAFEVLNRIEYSSPWTIKRTHVRSH